MIIRVTDSTHAGQARRHAATLADEANLGTTEGGSLAIVVTEMATNLVKHAQAPAPWSSSPSRTMEVPVSAFYRWTKALASAI